MTMNFKPRFVNYETLDPQLRRELQEIHTLRNLAVHGQKEKAISEYEARRFLEITKAILAQLTKRRQNQR